MSRKRNCGFIRVGEFHLQRKICRDKKTGLPTLYWGLSSCCSIGGEPLDSLCSGRPDETMVRETDLMPGAECIERVGEEELKPGEQEDSVFCRHWSD